MRFVDFLIFSNIFVAIPVTGLAWETQVRYLKAGNSILFLFVYASTLFLYCFHRIYRLSSADRSTLSERHLWAIGHLRLMQGITVVSAMMSIILFVQLTAMQWQVIGPVAIVSIAYTVPFPGTSKSLRDLPLVKIFLIAFSVTIVTVFLPLAGNIPLWDKHIMICALERFFFIVAITIPFDIRDASFDAAHHLRTLATSLGTLRSKWLAGTLLTLSGSISIFQYRADQISLPDCVSFLLTNIIGILAIGSIDRRSGERYFAFCIEGLMILHALLFFLATRL